MVAGTALACIARSLISSPLILALPLVLLLLLRPSMRYILSAAECKPAPAIVCVELAQKLMPS
jgi:hypothetical protein